MSKKAFRRLEQQIEGLSEQVAQVRERLDKIEATLDRPLSSAEILQFLDEFRAGETLGEAGFGAWIATCQTDCLRGGLRTIQLREGSHARLLEERLKELGGTPSAKLADDTENGFMQLYGSSELSDAEKLERLCGSPDVERALQGLEDKAARLGDDEETQSLVRTILQDERSSVSFLKEAHALLCS